MLAIIIERLLSLRASRVIPTQLFTQVLQLLRAGDDHPDTLTRLANSCALGAVLAETIRRRNHTPAERRLAVEDVGRQQAYYLNKYLPALGMIATIAPLLGLFGTVIGMIEIFAAYKPDGSDPAQLARGISVALYNTGFGILIAVPAIIAHRYFKSKVSSFIVKMEHTARQLDEAITQARRV